MIGPLLRPSGQNPVIKPNPESVFDCPMRGVPVYWKKLHTFNPAAVVNDGKIHVLYRAEDDSGQRKVGEHTSRLGLAESEDRIHFKHLPHPVIYPNTDDQQKYEWDGGCEDPRLVQTEDDRFILLYTQYNRRIPRLAAASSTDLIHWEKHGPVFKGSIRWKNLPTKSGAIVCKIVDGVLKAAKIHDKYWMYFGVRKLRLADSDDLLRWKPRQVVHKPRPGRYDSLLTEAGPPAVITEKGIVLLYNGENHRRNGDPKLAPETYSVGQILFDSNDLGKVLAITDEPCFKPELDFEKTGQYAAGTTFAEGLVFFKGAWYLYYGCADSFVGVAKSKKVQ